MNNRIEYIDAMRGFAMIMVVICHFFTWSFQYENPLYIYVNHILQIPLFFMISGFFASHMLRRSLLSIIWNKFIRLVVPAIIMLSLFVWVFDLNYVEALFHRFKYGYWFTFVMFGYVIIYVLVSRIFRCLKLSSKTSDCLHLLVGVLITYLALASSGLSSKWSFIELFSTVCYTDYFFFALGAVLYANRNYILNHLNNKWLLGGGDYIICNRTNSYCQIWHGIAPIWSRHYQNLHCNSGIDYNLETI